MNLIKGIKGLFYMYPTGRASMSGRLYVGIVTPVGDDDSRVNTMWNSRNGQDFTTHGENEITSLSYLQNLIQSHNPRGAP